MQTDPLFFVNRHTQKSAVGDSSSYETHLQIAPHRCSSRSGILRSSRFDDPDDSDDSDHFQHWLPQVGLEDHHEGMADEDFRPGGLRPYFSAYHLEMTHSEICHEIAGELEDMAKWLSRGELSPGQFRLLLSTLEKKKLERVGMRLSSTISVDGVVHFSLRFSEGEELCASMDVDPITGKLSTRLACS